MNTQQKMEVMQAYLDGKTIEVFAGCEYHTFAGEPAWRWKSDDAQPTYRVKPEPKFDWAIMLNEHVVAYLPQCTEADAKKRTLTRAECMVIQASEYKLRKLEDVSCAITF